MCTYVRTTTDRYISVEFIITEVHIKLILNRVHNFDMSFTEQIVHLSARQWQHYNRKRLYLVCNKDEFPIESVAAVCSIVSLIHLGMFRKTEAFIIDPAKSIASSVHHIYFFQDTDSQKDTKVTLLYNLKKYQR